MALETSPCSSFSDCICFLAGFHGDQCETPVKGCSGVTCKNGGTCISSGGHNYCECPVDKEGHDCDRGEISRTYFLCVPI